MQIATTQVAANSNSNKTKIIDESIFCELFDQLVMRERTEAPGLVIIAGTHPDYGEIALIQTTMGDYARVQIG